MNVLVDTNIWSLAFRRQRVATDDPNVAELRQLVQENRAQIIGIVRQELLSGIRDAKQFQTLKEHLRAFPDLPISTEDYEQAAEWFTVCRQHGVQPSSADMLICSVAHRTQLPIFTLDKDFLHYAEYLPIQRHCSRF